MTRRVMCVFVVACFCTPMARAAGVLIDHNDTDITVLTEAAMNNAKAKLHIAYGHTSHGSQLTTGMNGLVDFANGGGLGLSLPGDFFEWNNGGAGGGLDLHDHAMGGDCGYYPEWVDNTTNYLNQPAHSDVNVIIWSWCGQVDGKYRSGTLGSEYLTPMTTLETAYPDVTFVYMTGHVDHWDDVDNKAANQVIRNYCATNNKVLFDFADIESYGPDGTYYEFPNDNCDYYDWGGTKLGNWAEEWQGSHVESVDWYNCASAHSKPLNANRKAYGAWALWTDIAADVPTEGRFSGYQIAASDAGGGTTASILDGTAATARVIDQSWRAPGAGESQCAGDVLTLDGISPNPADELFVLQMSYDPADGNNVCLGWFDEGQWVNAIEGNSDGGAGESFVDGPYDGNLLLGCRGVDPATHEAWAVLDHNGCFAVITLPLGDTNGDGIVDAIDCSNLVAQFGDVPGAESADFNGDGFVDLEDFAILRGNFGFGVPSAPDGDRAAPIPEPATLIMLAGGLPLLLKRKRLPASPFGLRRTRRLAVSSSQERKFR